MNLSFLVGSICLGLFLGMLLLQEAGRRLGRRWLERNPDGGKAGFGALEGGILALLGLLLAFTFSGAASRFDERRQLVVEETNAIGTAYLRLDVLPEPSQPALRESFRRYLDARLGMYQRLPDLKAAEVELQRAIQLQDEIWKQAIAAIRAKDAPPHSAMVLLPALNEVFDIVTTRIMATRMHPPPVIFVMLFTVALASALLAGWGAAGSKSRSWLHLLSFTVVIAVTVYVILDMEYPRLGFIRVDEFDQALQDLRNGMK